MLDFVNALIVPTERPPTDIDLKRALLMFDQIHVLDPGDRELIPRHLFTHAVMPMPLPFFMDRGPVLPLGKMPGHDNFFEQTIQGFSQAVAEGVLSIHSAPPPSPALSLGGAPEITDRGDPGPVLGLFRNMLSDQRYLASAAQGLPNAMELDRLDPAEFAPGGLALTHEGPPIASLPSGELSSEHAELLNRAAAARLGTIVKCMDMAHFTGSHLYSTERGIQDTLSLMSKSAAESLSRIVEGTSDLEVARRAARVESILANLLLPDATLGAMSVKDVLQQRTKAWGLYGKARERFFGTVRRLAEEIPDDSDFDSRVREEVRLYLESSSSLRSEWSMHGLKIIGTGAGFPAAGQVASQLFQIESWAALGMFVGLASLKLAASDIPLVLDTWRRSRKNEAGTGRVLFSPYSGLKLGNPV